MVARETDNPTVRERLLARIDDLGVASLATKVASQQACAATLAAYEADANLAYAELDLRAKLHADGVPGSNAEARKATLDLAVMDDEDCSALRELADATRHARIATDARLREAEQRERSLRIVVQALTALVGAEQVEG